MIMYDNSDENISYLVIAVIEGMLAGTSLGINYLSKGFFSETLYGALGPSLSMLATALTLPAVATISFIVVRCIVKAIANKNSEESLSYCNENREYQESEDSSDYSKSEHDESERYESNRSLW
jgi:hypothetical protein